MHILEIIVTLGLGLAGLFLAHSVRRQLQVKTADARMHAYTALWEAMSVAARSPTTAMSGLERTRLHKTMTEWYFSGGHGMLMADGTGQLYRTATENLVCRHDEVKPDCVAKGLAALLEEEQQDAAHGALSARQLSLLRTRMKADIAVYGRVYDRDLAPADKAFLRLCGQNLLRRPWRTPSVPWKRRRQTPPVEPAAVDFYCEAGRSFWPWAVAAARRLFPEPRSAVDDMSLTSGPSAQPSTTAAAQDEAEISS